MDRREKGGLPAEQPSMEASMSHRAARRVRVERISSAFPSFDPFCLRHFSVQCDRKFRMNALASAGQLFRQGLEQVSEVRHLVPQDVHPVFWIPELHTDHSSHNHDIFSGLYSQKLATPFRNQHA